MRRKNTALPRAASTDMKRHVSCFNKMCYEFFLRHRVASLAMLVAAFSSVPCAAGTLALATYDNDSYMFVGLNSEMEPGLTLTEDYSQGVVAANNAHFIFSVIKFGNLAGLSTKAAGGGEKYLKLSTHTYPGPGTVAVSIATADIEADDATGYPSPLFTGNRFGLNVDRLRWYMANIKGDDPTFGGYAGGAPHLGVLDVSEPGSFYLKVTETVDSWVDGSRPNFGFGLWGVAVSGEQGNTFDLASIENPGRNGPQLVSSLPGSVSIPGDANGDGVVDRADLAFVVSNFGQSGGAGVGHGDFDGDGKVSLRDVVVLRSNFSLPPGGSAAAAVPEPASELLGAIGVILGIGLGAARAAAKRRSVPVAA